MIQKLKRYKNLILLLTSLLLRIALIASDPLGFCAQRAHDRAAIQNQIAIEKAEAEQRIAIIKARTEAELKRIEQGEEFFTEQETVLTETELDTPAEEHP